MYCQKCGKEIEERTEKCPHCESVVPNVYVPSLYSQEIEIPQGEKPVLTIKAVKPEKKMKRPSKLPLKITGIVMYSILLAYYLASAVNDFVTGHQYGFKTVIDVVFTVMFAAMLFFAISGKLDKKLTLISLSTFMVFELIYNILGIVWLIKTLLAGVSLPHDWYIIMALTIRLIVAVSMIVVLVFAFIFYLKKKFSPLPMCISSGIFLIFEIIALIFNIIIMALSIVPFDIFILLSLGAVYVYFGITIAQLFLFHIQDKYRVWVEENSI